MHTVCTIRLESAHAHKLNIVFPLTWTFTRTTDLALATGATSAKRSRAPGQQKIICIEDTGGGGGGGIPGNTHAALTRRLLVCGCPSVETKRICLGAEGSVGGMLLPPPFFWTEGWLIASEISTVVPEHWVLRIWELQNLNITERLDERGRGQQRSSMGQAGTVKGK